MNDHVDNDVKNNNNNKIQKSSECFIKLNMDKLKLWKTSNGIIFLKNPNYRFTSTNS